MKFNYKFQNLLGTVYRKGDILFTNDGNCVISPVGNRITIYDLKHNKSRTLSLESKYNYTALDISPNGSILLAVNEEGQAQMISLLSSTVIHRYKFKNKVNAVRFSPDGKYFAACCNDTVFVMTAPCSFTGEYRSFVMKRVFQKAHDETTCLDWSDCSKLLAVGSKDTTTKIYTVDYLDNINMYSLTGHTDKIVGVFFEKASLDLITVSRNGQVCLWDANLGPDDLVVSDVQISHVKRRKVAQAEPESEDDVDDKDIVERDGEQGLNDDSKEQEIAENNKLLYTKLGRHYIGDAIRSASHKVKLTAAQYHKQTKLLITGFSNGVFFLHEMPDVNLIHSLSVSEHRIGSIAASPRGDWLALACPRLGQLLVWEWQSEQYVMKQQGHSLDMTCVEYSSDGLHLVTGGYDGKLKLWNTLSGFCFVTFSDHKSTVTGITFSANKKFFVSSSLDGTVRCYDLTRYRNFRTMTSPSLVQFSCVTLDSAGELCAAGGQDVFDIYIWSVKFGKLLEVVGGHEAPVSGLAFSPAGGSSRLCSASWDGSLRVWDCLDSSSTSEPLTLPCEALNLAFRPDGEQIAVSTLDGNITFFCMKTSEQCGSIEGRNDLGSGRSDTDLVTPNKMLKTKAFTTLCYTADGSCLLAAGNSKNVCLYNVKEAILIKKFVITQNRSLDAVDDFINRRLLSEWGNMSLLEQRDQLEGGDVTLRLPGVQQGDMADRRLKPEVRVWCSRVSPAGDTLAVAATEGLLLYSLRDCGPTSSTAFRPVRLELSSTATRARDNLRRGEWGEALLVALQLNEATLVQEVIESVPHTHVELLVSSLDDDFTDLLLEFLAHFLEDSRHLEHLLIWVKHIVNVKKRKFPLSVLLALEKALTVKHSQLSKICDFNKYTIRCVKAVSALAPKMEADHDEESSGRGTASDTDSD